MDVHFVMANPFVRENWCEDNGGLYQDDTCEFDDVTVHFDGSTVTVETPEGTTTVENYAIPQKVEIDGKTRFKTDDKEGQPLVAYNLSEGGFKLDTEEMVVEEVEGISDEEIETKPPEELAERVPDGAPMWGIVKDLFVGDLDEHEFSEESREQFRDEVGRGAGYGGIKGLMSGNYQHGASNALYVTAAHHHGNDRYSPPENYYDMDDHLHPEDVTEEQRENVLKTKKFNEERLRLLFGDKLPVWRGTSQKAINRRLDDGSICVEPNVVTSNSIDPSVAGDYSRNLVLERTIDVEDTWGSYLTTPFFEYGGEREVVVGHESEECYTPDEFSEPRSGDEFDKAESVFRRYQEWNQ